jgi:hypothetical protein
VRSSAVWIAACGWATLSFAADRPNVDDLIHRLGDNNFEKREAASKAIETLGPEALPALQKAKDNLDPEIRVRVATLIPKAILAPQKTTLHLKQRPVREALEAVAKRAGYMLKVRDDSDRAGVLSDFDFDSVPFWVALDTICSQNGLVEDPYGREPSTPSLAFWTGPAPYVHHHGPFRFVATGFEDDLRRSVNLAPYLNPPPSVIAALKIAKANASKSGPPMKLATRLESFNMTFTFEAEPRLHIESAALAQMEVAQDDRNHSMLWPLAPRVRAARSVWVRRGQSMALSTSLDPPAPGATSMQVVKGVVAVKVGKEHHVRIISDQVLSATGVKCTANDATIEIEEVRKTTRGYEIRYLLTGHRFGTPDLELTDSKGNAFYHASYGINKDWEGHVEFVPPAGGTPAPGEPAKLSWSWWDTFEYQVPFEFRNLPLP